MPTDQLAALGDALESSPDPSDARRRSFAWLASMRRPGRPSLHDFNDHMLADIGLLREGRRLRVRPPEPWFPARHLR